MQFNEDGCIIVTTLTGLGVGRLDVGLDVGRSDVGGMHTQTFPFMYLTSQKLAGEQS